MSNYQMFCTTCATCGATTSKSYARAHGGNCKACSTGEPKREVLCPDCGVHRLTAYQIKHHYHCDACTREADPVGYANEVRGFYDYPDSY